MGSKKTEQNLKSSLQIMEETFVLVVFSFIIGTLLAVGLFWLITNQFTYNGEQEVDEESVEIELIETTEGENE